MQKIIGVTDLQRRFRAVFDEVAKDHDTYVLTRSSRPEAVLIPYDEYVRYQQTQESDVLRRVDEMIVSLAERNAGYTTREVASGCGRSSCRCTPCLDGRGSVKNRSVLPPASYPQTFAVRLGHPQLILLQKAILTCLLSSTQPISPDSSSFRCRLN